MNDRPDRVILIPAEHAALAGRTTPGGVHIACVDRFTSQGLHVRMPEPRVLRPGSVRIVVLLGGNPGQLEALQHLRDDLLAHGYGDMPPAGVVSEPTTSGAIAEAALDLLLDLADERAGLLSAETRKLAALRREHEDLQRAFDEAEAALQAHGLAPFRMVFAASPRDPPGSGAAGAQRFEQLLPVSSEGLAAVALHFATPSSAGTCRVTLRSPEDDRQLGTWNVAAGAGGWTMFALPRAATGMARSAKLILETRDGATLPSLAMPHPIPDYCAQVFLAESHKVLDAPLALRIWTGVPGSGVPAEVTRDADRLAVRKAIPDAVLAQAVPMASGAGGDKPALHVSGDAVHCTSLPGRIAAAALVGALDPGARTVTVDVELASSSARMQFALAAGPVLGNALGTLIGREGGPHSGWSTPGTGGMTRLALRLDGAVSAPLTLAFGIRAAEEEPAAEMVFRNFEVWL